MKTNRWIAALALASCAWVASTQTAVTLRRTFVENQEDVYKVATLVDQEIDASAFGGPSQTMKIDMSMTMSYKTGKFDAEKKVAPVTVTVKDIDMKADMGAIPGMEMPKEYVIKGNLNERNIFSDLKVEGLTGMMRMQTQNQLSSMMNVVSFPEGAIKIGDTWDVEWPKTPGMEGSESKMKATYSGDKEVDGFQVMEIAVKGPIILKIDPSKMGGADTGDNAGNPMAGMKMSIDGTMQMDNAIQIEKGTGRLVKMDSRVDSDMMLDLVDMNVKMPIKGKVTTIMKLQPKK